MRDSDPAVKVLTTIEIAKRLYELGKLSQELEGLKKDIGSLGLFNSRAGTWLVSVFDNKLVELSADREALTSALQAQIRREAMEAK